MSYYYPYYFYINFSFYDNNSKFYAHNYNAYSKLVSRRSVVLGIKSYSFATN